METTQPATCPIAPLVDEDNYSLIGCGSTNVQWDPDDKVFDCLNCGIWFTPDQYSHALAHEEEAPNAR